MHLRVFLGEVLPVCGTVGLLGLWMFRKRAMNYVLERGAELTGYVPTKVNVGT